jgi:argininosuccinate lyase
MLKTAAAAATLSVTLSGVAEDLILFANRGLVELDDDYASTSSIMPQKKNPDTLELVRATVGDTTGGVAGLLTTLKGLPRAYNRDLQRATGALWDALDAVGPAVEVAVGAVATATWDEDALGAGAAEGFSTATGVADRLAMAGLPFRTAHEVVATAAERAGGETPDLSTLEAAVEAVPGSSLADVADPENVAAALLVEESVAMRDSRGGPAPAALSASLERARDGVAGDRNTLDARQSAADEAADELAAEVARHA